MKIWKKRVIFLAGIFLIFLMIGAVINFSAYNSSGERDLYVQIAIDRDYVAKDPHLGFRIPKMLDNVSEFYWQEFKIRLIMPRLENYTLFKSKSELAGMKELDFLSKSFPEGDIIIGFTGRKLPKPKQKPVYADADSFMVLITNQYPPSGQIQLIKHEVAHLFSAKHQFGTIMDKTPENFVMSDDPAMQNFSDFNKTIIKFNKYRNFTIIKLFYRIYDKLY